MNRRTWSWSRAGALALVVAVSVVLIVIVIKWAPQWLAATKGLRPTDRAAELGRVRTALLATLAGVIAVVGAYYTSRTFALNRQGQITERFTRAMDQLGNDGSMCGWAASMRWSVSPASRATTMAQSSRSSPPTCASARPGRPAVGQP